MRSIVKNEVEASKKDGTTPSAAELILTVDDRVAQITIAPNSKRMILETALATTSQENSLSQDSDVGVEIWNLEFAVARPETFSKASPYLISRSLNSAAFDQKGDRVFWANSEATRLIAREVESSTFVMRGADADSTEDAFTFPSFDVSFPFDPPAVKTEEVAENPVATDQTVQGTESKLDDEKENVTLVAANPIVDDAPPSVPTVAEVIRQTPARRAHRDYEYVVRTKSLEADAFSFFANSDGRSDDDEVKRLKTSEITKDALRVRISPQARWLVCQEMNVDDPAVFKTLAEETAESKNNVTELDAEDGNLAEVNKEREDVERFDFNWALVPVRDSKRVVRFPELIKMTFDSSTSNDEIFGRTVDVLDVSDESDLVATLVEEIMPQDSARALRGDANQNPRCKIVVWDLNVAKTVDLEKAKYPLRAIEVAQIAIPHRIERQFCKFSPSGKTFAARVEPKYITIWQSVSGRRIVELDEPLYPIHSFAYAPGETKMIVGVGDKQARVVLWEIRKGIVCRTLDDYAPDAVSIDAVAFSPDERYVYFANNVGEIKRWNIRPQFTRE